MSPDQTFKAAGNACPASLMIASLQPLLKTIKDIIATGFDFNAWPSRLSSDVPDECYDLARRLSAAPRKAKPRAKRPRSGER
eukprot:4237582-Pyramimonas_sp.AAC.1